MAVVPIAAVAGAFPSSGRAAAFAATVPLRDPADVVAAACSAIRAPATVAAAAAVVAAVVAVGPPREPRQPAFAIPSLVRESPRAWLEIIQ